MLSERRHARRRRALLALVIGVVIVAASGVAGNVAYAKLKGQAEQLQAQLTAHLQTGQGELEAAKGSLKQANANHDETLIAQAKAHFAAAKAEFAVAAQIADTSALLHRLEALPAVAGLAHSRHAAVDGIAAMGAAISDAGQELADLDGNLIKPPTAGGQEGRTLLTVLNQTHGSLGKVRIDLDRAQEAAAQVEVQVLPEAQQATFVKARDTITSALAGLDEFNRLVPVLTEILGGNGARTFLIEQVNPAELRGGGGFIGSFSVLQADHGTLKLVTSGDGYQLSKSRTKKGQPGYVVPPGPLQEFVPNTSWSFEDSNFYADFPTNAKAGEGFAQPQLGTHIDAVISIDYYAVAKMLELTGPLSVPGFGTTVDANNFIPELLRHDVAGDAVHKAILAAIAGPLMDRISALPPDRWPALIGALNDLAAARHFQAYFNNEMVEQEIDRVGWSGAVHPTILGDYMMEFESNLGATKANYFVSRHFTVELTRRGRVLHHKVTVDLVNNMTNFSFVGNFYRAYVSLYVPGEASSASDSLRASAFASAPPPAETLRLDGWVVPEISGYGGHGWAVFEYDTPWPVADKGQANIYWQKQAGTVNDRVDVTWNDGSGHVYTVSGDLAQDRVIGLRPTGVTLTPGRPAQAQLPSLSLG